MALIIIVGLSVFFQLVAVLLAVRLIRTTRSTTAWLLVAVAIGLMAVRRLESLAVLITGVRSPGPNFLFESIGLVTSVFMLGGIYLIQPIFESIVRSKEELREAHEKLSVLSREQQLLLDHTTDFIYRHDSSGMITYVSPAVERITGYTPQEWRAHYTKHYTDNPVNKNGVSATEEMIRTGQAQPSYTIEVRHREGHAVWLEVNKQPYLLENKVAGFIGVARDITKRVRLEHERETLITDLQEALGSIKTLKGLLPICASCKKVRDDKGYWSQIEAYVSDHSEAEFSHGICPDCAQRLYPEFVKKPKA